MILDSLGRLLTGTLRRQLVGGMVLIVATMMSLFVWDLTRRQQAATLEHQSDQAAALAQSVAASAAVWVASRDYSGLQEIVTGLQYERDLQYAMILDTRGEVLAHTDASRLGLYLSDLPSRPVLEFLARDPVLVDVASPISLAGNQLGWVRIGLGRLSMSEQLAGIVRNAILYVLAAIALATVLSTLAARSLTHRLATIQSVADAVQAGHDDLRADSKGVDEAAQLARQFNNMLDTMARRSAALGQANAALRSEFDQRRDVEEKLLQFKQTLDQTLDCVFMFEAETLRFTYVNQGGLSQIGYSQAEILQMYPYEIKPEFTEAQFRALVVPLLTGDKKQLVFETVHQHKNGGRLPVEIFLQYISPPGQTPRFVAVVRDITERKRAETQLARANEMLEVRVAERTQDLLVANGKLSDALEALKQTQDELVRNERLASLGSLVAGVAHELNTPIGNSLMVATTLEDDARQVSADIETGELRRSELKRFLENTTVGTSLLTRNLVRASELITNFKQVSVDQTSAQRRKFDLATVVNEILAMMQPQLKNTPHKVLVDIPDGIQMDGFPGPLGQVIVNLINNCVVHAFTDAVAGTVTIVGHASKSNSIRLAISDDGCGMTSDILSKVFDPFFTTKMGQGGSGLGLHIVYSIVTQILGGAITVSSSVGEASVFEMDLPLVAPEPGSAKRSNGQPA